MDGRYYEMPFGKHEGQPLASIPLSYLRWVLRECCNIDDELRDAIRDCLRRRTGDDATPPRREQGRPVDAIDRGTLRDIVHQWFRKLAFEYHHDRGNDQNVMRALNVAHDRLKEALRI